MRYTKKSDWPRYEEYARRHGRRWSRLNDVLYAMCRTMPAHEDVSEIHAKVGIIGRTYASGIERHAASGLDPIVDTLRRCARWLDPALADLGRRDRAPRRDDIARLTSVHGRVLGEIVKCTRSGNRPRSFVSKYLHFHAPVFPIYDSVVAGKIQRRDWYPWSARLSREYRAELPRLRDDVYWRFVVRIVQIAEDWEAAGLEPTARKIDTYLYQAAP